MTDNHKQANISVLIFSYQFEHYIAEAIESVLAQTLQPMEIFICDDHSTDRSWEIIQSYARRFPDLIVARRHPRNIGHIANGVFARRHAQGEWLSPLDGDDRWQPRKLELEWAALRNDPEAKVAYSGVTEIDPAGRPLRQWVTGTAPPSGDVFVPVFSKRFFSGNRAVFRNPLVERAAFKAVGIDHQDIPIHIDWDQKIRLSAQYRVAYSGANLVEYRIHDRGLSQQKRAGAGKSIRKVYQKNAHLLSQRSLEDALTVKWNIDALLCELGEPGLSDKSSGIRYHINTPSRQRTAIRLANSLPKSGTYLLRKLMQLFGLQATEVHISKQLTGYQINGVLLPRTIPAGVDWPEPIAPEAVRNQLSRLRYNQFATAHMPYSNAFGAVLENMNVRSALILRDPRDVVVSHARYITEEPTHFLYHRYKTMDKDDRLMASIIGIRQNAGGGPMLLDIRQRWRSVMPWRQQPYNYTTTFEKLVGPQGGGDAEIQMSEIRNIAEHFDIQKETAFFENVAANLYGGTTTFRKGQIGKWREHFKQAHIDAFKKLAGDILVELGYEADQCWG